LSRFCSTAVSGKVIASGLAVSLFVDSAAVALGADTAVCKAACREVVERADPVRYQTPAGRKTYGRGSNAGAMTSRHPLADCPHGFVPRSAGDRPDGPGLGPAVNTFPTPRLALLRGLANSREDQEAVVSAWPQRNPAEFASERCGADAVVRG
jgi:hypothetical protein